MCIIKVLLSPPPPICTWKESGDKPSVDYCTVCWGPGSNIVTTGRGCDSVDPIFNYMDTHKLCTLPSILAKICA